jgi:hypothetical protein
MVSSRFSSRFSRFSRFSIFSSMVSSRVSISVSRVSSIFSMVSRKKEAITDDKGAIMNNMSYEEALKQLKVLEAIQGKIKKDRNKFAGSWGSSFVSQSDYSINTNKRKINMLLSVIHAHKAARRLYAENYRLKRDLIRLKNPEVVIG